MACGCGAGSVVSDRFVVCSRPFVLAGNMRHVLLVFSVLILVTPPVLGLEGVAAVILLGVIVRSHAACRLK